MDDHPAERLAAITDTSKREDETLKEYVRRVGTARDVDDAVLAGGIEYVTEWQYSSDSPGDIERYERFLDAFESSQPVAESELESDGIVEDASASSTQPRQGNATESEGMREPIEELAGRETSADADGFRSGLKGKEPRKLLVRFAVIVVTAPLLGWLMGRSWVPEHQLYEQGERVLSGALGLSAVRAIELVGMFSLGLYLALLALFLFDIKKRVQGMLLLIGSVLALVVLSVMNVFIPNIEFTAPLNVLGLVLGVAVGILIESGQLLALDWERTSFRRPTLKNGAVPEFRYAAGLIFVLLSMAVIITLIQGFLANVAQVYDVAAAGIFLVTLGQFIQYESETNYMTLGPERAGKSMLMLGLVLELRSNSVTDPDPNEYLQNGLERASNLQRGDERWPISSTSHDSVRVASFEVISGYYFPRRLQLSALDYAGQHLGQVANRFEQGNTDDEMETVHGEIAGWLADADTLLFILDVERLVYPNKFQEADITDEANISWGLEHYAKILDHTDSDDIVVVATKCDILIDQRSVESLSTYDSFEQFREAVTDHLTSRPDVDQLLSLAGESDIHPVYFATKQRDGEYVPHLDETENLCPVGYDHLLDELRERQ